MELFDCLLEIMFIAVIFSIVWEKLKKPTDFTDITLVYNPRKSNP